MMGPDDLDSRSLKDSEPLAPSHMCIVLTEIKSVKGTRIWGEHALGHWTTAYFELLGFNRKKQLGVLLIPTKFQIFFPPGPCKILSALLYKTQNNLGFLLMTELFFV